MAILFDGLLTHVGWQGGTFATGGWNDRLDPLITGLAAGSYWAEVLNGQRTDFAASFRSRDNSYIGPYWINLNTAGTITGQTLPAGFVITPDIQVETYTRTLTANGAINIRLRVGDGPTTPPPSSPP